jgi:hypothetical protein
VDENQRATQIAGLLNAQLTHLTQTRDIEFKTNLALWTAIIAAGGAAYTAKFRFQSNWSLLWFLLGGFGFSAGHALLWMLPIRASVGIDQHWIKQYRGAIEELCHFNAPEPKAWSRYRRSQQSKSGGWIWIGARVGTTFVFILIVALVLFFAPKSN